MSVTHRAPLGCDPPLPPRTDSSARPLHPCTVARPTSCPALSQFSLGEALLREHGLASHVHRAGEEGGRGYILVNKRNKQIT